MKKLALAFLFTTLSIQAYSAAPGLKKCAELIANGLTLSETFILLATRKLEEDKHLPNAGPAVYRLMRMDNSDGADKSTFATVLAEYKLTVDEWKEVQDVEWLDGSPLGTESFLKALHKPKSTRKKMSAEEREIFKKLNTASEAAKLKLRFLLASAEQVHFAEANSMHSEESLLNELRRFSRDPKMQLSALGISDIHEWRYAVLTERESLRTGMEKALRGALLQIVEMTSEIPESEPAIFTAVAEKLGITEADLKAFFGPKSVFRTMSELVDHTKGKHPAAFKKVIDRRYFSDTRRQAMLEAVRTSNDIILFKLAENQDLKDFEAVKALAKSMNAPIIVAPAFAEIGTIPEKLGWLFDEPNVHFMVDRGMQITRDFYVVDHGYEDKRQNPFMGLEQIYQPTDRVLLFHPKVRAVTRATGNYATRPGYMVTTGSMSDPAYWGKFAISMSTDERAQAEAEMNRSVVILSRRYRSDRFGNLVGSANGIAPRRARFTEARYGNPAGLFDLGKIYSDTGVVDVKSIPALVLGDVHLGNTDPLFLKATHEALESLRIIEKNPKAGGLMEPDYRQGPVGLGAIVLHDLIEGSPNNRHNMDSLLTRAIYDTKGALDLENHVQTAAAWVKQLTQLLPDTSVVIPVDNHGSDWLIKRLQEADLFKGGRPKEIPIVLQLMLDAIKDKANPYERIFQYYGIDTDRVLFMSKQDTYRVGIDLQNPTSFRMVHGSEIGQHSHMGINGAKAISLAKLLVAYGANVTGHTHSSAEFGQSVKVGTGTPVQQDYHRGPSNSDASIALVYSDQAMQLLRMEKGSFVPNAAPQAEGEFFPGAEYPRLLIRKMPPGGPTTDQYRADPPANRGPRK